MNSKPNPSTANRQNRLLILMLLLLIVAGLGYWAFSESDASSALLSEEQAAEVDQALTKAPLLRAPLAQITEKGEHLMIENPGEPSSFTLKSGTTIRIPAKAFKNANGEIVREPVRVQIREYRDAAEIIASGIPMRVHQEDGSEEWMQTAGMFSVDAYCNGSEVQLAEGKTMDINFISLVDGDYDFWKFDEKQANWDNIGSSENPTPVAQETSGEELAEAERLRSLIKNKPARPDADEGNILGFTDLDVSKLPALREQNPVMLAYAGDDAAKAPKNNAWVHKVSWFKKKIEPTAEDGVYQLTLLGDSLYSIKVRRALTGPDLERARAKYKERMDAYQANLAALRDIEATRAAQKAFSRAISISNTGIYNYDILWKQPEAVPLMADFDFDGLPAAAKENVVVYLVTGEGRVVIGLPQQDWHKLRVNLNADNKMLAVLPGKKVAYFSQSAFEENKSEMEASSGKDYIFDMTVEERDVSQMEDLRALLKQASS
jgi:hypothetical protein